MKTEEVIEIAKNKRVKDFSFLNNFWGTNFSDIERKKLKLFINVHKLRNIGLSSKKISKELKKSKSTIDKWLYGNSIPYIAHYLKYYSQFKDNKKRISINSTRGGLLIGPWIIAPEKVKSYSQIKKVVTQLTPKSELSLAYILGVIVGDASKHGIKRKNRIARRIQLRLTTKHETNKNFGEYVSYCLRNLKIRIHRTKNCPRGKRNPNEFYAWHSQCSSLIDWMLKACLGINDNELTTYNKIKANWILNTPKKFRIAFLQGIADSDGYVDITQYRAGIVTKPNAEFIQKVFNSFKIKSYIGNFHKGNIKQVKIRLEDADKLPLFNPTIKSYRYQLMKKAINAKKLKHHWPIWLGNQVNSYLKDGLSSTKIINNILNKYNITIRQGGIKKRRDKLKMSGKELTVLGIESTALV